MKSILLNVLAILFCNVMLANAPATMLPSEIKSVTVYRSGAQVYRAGSAKVPAGQSILKFSGLAADLSPASIQFTATGDFTILSVNFQRNFINPLEHSEEAKAIQAQIETIGDQLRRKEIEIQVLKEEESLLLANKQIGGQQNGVQLDDLKAIAEYYRNRLKEIKMERLTLEADTKKLSEEQEKLRQQLAEISAKLGQKASGEIWVNVTADRAVDSKFQMSYMVPNAGWSPSYDLRVADVGEAVQLDLKGNVHQATGEDWKGIQLSLSTGIPTESGVKPELQPWWLAPYQPTVYYSAPGKAQALGSVRDQAMASESMAKREEMEEDAAAAYVSVDQFERTTTREYRINLPYDVPSDGKPYMVSMEQYELPADYQYYVAPKLDQDVFLTAKVSGWDEYKLLSGPANLFFEGSFLGRTQLNMQQTADTLDLSLGRDKGIIVTRVKDEQFKDKQFIGTKVTQKTGWKIELRNTKSKAVRVIVEDQFPISTTDEIEVELTSSKGGTVDKENGKLTWQVDLKPGKSEELHFQYEVKYPKRMGLILE